MDDLLSIGAFARRCGLSRSALRFYDECGLLPPATVGEESGYRYYAAAQLTDALLIRRLREAELPVLEVRRFLGGDVAERREILSHHAERLEQRVVAVRGAVGELRRELDRPAPGVAGGWCEISSAALATGLAQVAFAAGTDPTRPALTGVWIETRDESLRLVATDSYRMAVRDLTPEPELSETPIRGVIAPERLDALRTALRQATSASVRQQADGTLHTVLGQETIKIGGRSDTFPDYEQILSGLPSGHLAVAGREAFIQALAGFADPTAPVTLHLAPGVIGLAAGQTDVAIDATWDGPKLSVNLRRGFLSDALAVMVGPDVVLEAVDPLRPVTLRCADTGTLSVLTMPIRVDP